MVMAAVAALAASSHANASTFAALADVAQDRAVAHKYAAGRGAGPTDVFVEDLAYEGVGSGTSRIRPRLSRPSVPLCTRPASP